MKYNNGELVNMNRNDNELVRNKVEHLNAFISDVRRYRYNKKKKGKRDWLYIIVIVTLLIVILIFPFFLKFNESKDIVVIILRGNGQIQIGRQGLPIHSWKCNFMQGEIDFIERKKIVIKKSGLYNLYAQMLFYRNEIKSPRNFTMNSVMDFGVSEARTKERLIAATVSIYSCSVACTRYVSAIVWLRKDDILLIDTATPGVYFKMIKEKAFFGAYLISTKGSDINQDSHNEK